MTRNSVPQATAALTRLARRHRAALLAGLLAAPTSQAAPLNLADEPLFLGGEVAPRIMLGLSNDHQLYFKAYDDYSDLDGDGSPDTTYDHSIDYYGYFDESKCYDYDTDDDRFEPIAFTGDKYCDDGTGNWSGNFLNWASMTRVDVIRKILYGGSRSTDTSSMTVLERSYLPNEAHSFAKYYNGSDLAKLTPFDSVNTGGNTNSNGFGTGGITLCNTTATTTKWSQDVTDPPLLRVADGNYALWSANERWQCLWSEEESASNGNKPGQSGLKAHGSNPSEANDGLGEKDYAVRVQVCVDDGSPDLIRNGEAGDLNNENHENCREYPDGNFKPAGLLQVYGENADAEFGLITGSYKKNKSGGVVRKNTGEFGNEVKADSDGTFKAQPADGGIIATLEAFRIVDYNHDNGLHKDCGFDLVEFSDGECINWGNPQSEMFLETLRYFAGKQPTAAFKADDSTLLSGLKSPDWEDPIADSDKFCAPLNVLQFNASTVSYDGDELDGFSDIQVQSGDTLNAATNEVGEGENIHGNDWFVGQLLGTDQDDELCTAKTIQGLADVRGTCPNAPRLSGSYHMAGLAHYAHTNDIRDDREEDQKVTTYGVSLSPDLPSIDVPVPGTDRTVTLLPACRNTGNASPTNCAIVDFKIVEQDLAAGTGKLYVNWEDAEQGSDFDQDMWGTIEYSVDTTPATPEITVTTDTFAQSTDDVMGFGYVINGTTADGFHVHSGANDFDFSDPVAGVPGCEDCAVADPATSATYVIGDSDARNLRNPLYYASKWGAFEEEEATTNGKPDLQSEWDDDGDGVPDTYFFAQDPRALEESLEDAFLGVVQTESSSAAVALNSQSFSGDSRLYQARFNSVGWTGQLLAFDLIERQIPVAAGVTEEFTEVVPASDPSWDAGEELDATDPDSREIITYKPSNADGIAFRWPTSLPSTFGPLTTTGSNELDVEQALALSRNPGSGNLDYEGEARLDYLRGDQSNEGTASGSFRRRTSVMGDLINSAPVYVGGPRFLYPESFPNGSETSYSAFADSRRDREAMVYVGGNGGMLHGVDADSGDERFAFVPAAVFDDLNELTDPAYQHRYYVDGSPTYADAYFDEVASGWRSVIVGGLRGGGRAIYALDVTDPSKLGSAEANAEDIVLWEFDDEDTSSAGNGANGDADLGLTYSAPSVVRLANGDWAAIFGNGYNNSGSGSAVLYIVRLETGELIRKIDTGAGAATDPVTGATRPNGLASPAPVDVDGDAVADLVYAGDLFGNLWKFDLRGTSPSGWGVHLEQGGTPEPLFTATNDDNPSVTQSITVRPQIGRHPAGKDGYMVYFGTGKYLEGADNSQNDQPTNTFYGIWDRLDADGDTTTVFDRDDLLEQEITLEATKDTQNPLLANEPADVTLRTTTDNTITKWYDGQGPDKGKGGWYLDLESPNGDNRGEKAVTDPILRAGRIIFTTLIPSTSPCEFGGDGWIMELDATDGSRLEEPPFDINKDGTFTFSGDATTDGKAPSGIKRNAVISRTAIQTKGLDKETKLTSQSSGQVDSLTESSGDEDRGRQSWEELR